MTYRKVVLSALCFTSLLNIISAYDDVTYQEWTNFKLHHSKKYESQIEEKYRYKIFVQNKLKIANHNEMYEKGLVTYDMEMNHFGDMLPHEFIRLMTGLDVLELQNLKENASHFIPPAAISIGAYPTEVDWRHQGAVTKVKDQGRCGSCWAFSTTGVLEGQYFRQKGHLVEFSEQNLLDCSSPYGNQGCQVGNPVKAYRYVQNNNGIDSAGSYPYEGVEKDCRYNPKYLAAKVTGYTILTNSEEELKTAVANVGPISVCVDGTHFPYYKSGVYYDLDCSTTNLNHAVLVVGYGSDPQKGDFWLIKNSWGTSWGLDGYMKLARNRGNHCGVASFATYALL